MKKLNIKFFKNAIVVTFPDERQLQFPPLPEGVSAEAFAEGLCSRFAQDGYRVFESWKRGE